MRILVKKYSTASANLNYATANFNGNYHINVPGTQVLRRDS